MRLIVSRKLSGGSEQRAAAIAGAEPGPDSRGARGLPGSSASTGRRRSNAVTLEMFRDATKALGCIRSPIQKFAVILLEGRGRTRALRRRRYPRALENSKSRAISSKILLARRIQSSMPASRNSQNPNVGLHGRIVIGRRCRAVGATAAIAW